MSKNFENLANAIVMQAVVDYRLAMKKQKMQPLDNATKHTKREVLRFFRSDWYSVLTSLDPEVLIAKLNKEVV